MIKQQNINKIQKVGVFSNFLPILCEISIGDSFLICIYLNYCVQPCFVDSIFYICFGKKFS